MNKDYAISSFEASRVIGTHFTHVGKLHGKLRIKAIGTKTYAYSLTDAIRYREVFRHPADEDEVRVVTEACEESPVLFNDTIGVQEASLILDVHPSTVTRLVTSGRLVGRRLAGRDAAKCWVVSEKAAIALAKERSRAAA